MRGIEQPMAVTGRPVTFWENAQDREEYARLDEPADLLRRLHRLREPKVLGLPHFDPFAKVRGSLATMEGLGDEDRRFLSERAERLRKEYERLDFVLPFGVVHGDANVGNAIRRRDGRAVLIDLDGFCLAPREWDLVLTSLHYERYGRHTRVEYDSFVHRYGFELMDWPDYPILADLRELMMTLRLGRRITADERAAREFAGRMHAIRTNGSRRDWQPF
ncbi:phosphotransferase [Streptomyces alkaliphilus]|uniref:Phosphotransferase n=1 Tax=Streptomyces alkaliphilus TaxID=1472722 RepID=A0A7W3TCI8_9ACTN|nr:phosphotransferase [Streptomyces alkaliphilus]MBB0244253.1 phosphotransferase [Streptomyces alkaliphilus]